MARSAPPIQLLAGVAFFLARRALIMGSRGSAAAPAPACTIVDWGTVTASFPLTFRPLAAGDCLEITEIPATIAGRLREAGDSWSLDVWSPSVPGLGTARTWTITFHGGDGEDQMLFLDNDVPGSTFLPGVELIPPN